MNTKFDTWDKTERKYITVDNPATLPAGTVVTQWWWAESLQRWVTIPGASLQEVQADGSLRELRDDE